MKAVCCKKMPIAVKCCEMTADFTLRMKDSRSFDYCNDYYPCMRRADHGLRAAEHAVMGAPQQHFPGAAHES